MDQIFSILIAAVGINQEQQVLNARLGKDPDK